MTLSIFEGCHVRLRNGTIHGPVTLKDGLWKWGQTSWLSNGRYKVDGELHTLDIVAVLTEHDAKHIKIAMDNVDMSFTGAQFDEWLSDVRKAAPTLTNKDIAKGIGRSDQWISNASSRGVNHHSALALWYYLDGLQKNCNQPEGTDNVQDQRQRGN